MQHNDVEFLFSEDNSLGLADNVPIYSLQAEVFMAQQSYGDAVTSLTNAIRATFAQNPSDQIARDSQDKALSNFYFMRAFAILKIIQQYKTNNIGTNEEITSIFEQVWTDADAAVMRNERNAGAAYLCKLNKYLNATLSNEDFKCYVTYFERILNILNTVPLGDAEVDGKYDKIFFGNITKNKLQIKNNITDSLSKLMLHYGKYFMVAYYSEKDEVNKVQFLQKAINCFSISLRFGITFVACAYRSNALYCLHELLEASVSGDRYFGPLHTINGTDKLNLSTEKTITVDRLLLFNLDHHEIDIEDSASEFEALATGSEQDFMNALHIGMDCLLDEETRHEGTKALGNVIVGKLTDAVKMQDGEAKNKALEVVIKALSDLLKLGDSMRPARLYCIRGMAWFHLISSSSENKKAKNKAIGQALADLTEARKLLLAEGKNSTTTDELQQSVGHYFHKLLSYPVSELYEGILKLASVKTRVKALTVLAEVLNKHNPLGQLFLVNHAMTKDGQRSTLERAHYLFLVLMDSCFPYSTPTVVKTLRVINQSESSISNEDVFAKVQQALGQHFHHDAALIAQGRFTRRMLLPMVQKAWQLKEISEVICQSQVTTNPSCLLGRLPVDMIIMILGSDKTFPYRDVKNRLDKTANDKRLTRLRHPIDIPTVIAAIENLSQGVKPAANRKYLEAQIHLTNGDYPRAIVELGVAIESKPDPQYYYTRARAYHLLGSIPEAKADLLTALKIDPCHAASHFLYGFLCHFDILENTGQGIKNYLQQASLEIQKRRLANKEKTPEGNYYQQVKEKERLNLLERTIRAIWFDIHSNLLRKVGENQNATALARLFSPPNRPKRKASDDDVVNMEIEASKEGEESALVKERPTKVQRVI